MSIYGRRTPPAAYLKCDGCGMYLRQRKDGELFAHRRGMAKGEIVRDHYRSYTRNYEDCPGKAVALPCPACDSTGFVPLLGEYEETP